METKITIDDLVTVIKVVRNNQKTQLARINKLEKKVKSLEKDLENEKQETDKRFDNAIDRWNSMDDFVNFRA